MKHVVRKRFGQNFLNNDYIINQIINIIAPNVNDNIVEIGPGFGALTVPLLQYVDKLNVIEIDRDIVKYLQNKYPSDKLIVHNVDSLQFDFSFNNTPIRVVGNLPYNISTPILFYLATFPNIVDMYFMLQNEVVNRICASPHNSDYGRLSVMMQYQFDCYKVLNVDKKNFNPTPQVQSAIIHLVPKKHISLSEDGNKLLSHIVSAAFSKRRKTIANSLKNIIDADILTILNIDNTKRAENITVDEYIAIANYQAKSIK